MRRTLTLLLTIALALAAAVPASADTPTRIPLSKILFLQQGSALAEVESMDSVPLGWGSSARQAITAAEHNGTLIALHRRQHPLRVLPFVWRAQHPYWYVEFFYRGKIVADADVSPAGKVTGVWTGPQAWAPYAHGNQASILSTWMLLLPTSLLFLLPFFDPRRLRRLVHLDALAVLAFLVSYLLLDGAHLESAVWLAYPPLIYLLVRLLRVGFARGRRPAGRLAPLLSMRTLVIGLPLILIGRILVSLLAHQEIDVGYESVIGAYRLLHHLPLYYADPNHGDTYGPIAYLAYVPFELLFPWSNTLNSLHAADVAAIFFDLGTVLGLVLLGRRLRPGREGMRLGLVLGWAWAACPFTTIGLIVHTNDGLVAMLSVLALLVISSPVVTGAVLGLATAAKFSPAGLLPLMAAPRQRGLKGALICVGTFVAVVVAAVGAWLPPGGLSFFWHRTIGFQINRVDVFSPWALHPGLHPLQLVLEVGAVLLAGAVAFFPRQRSLPRVCALAAAVTLAIQLPATHWYYYYIMWFLPFALVAWFGWTPAADRGWNPADELPDAVPDRAECESALVGV
jgi:hypothetical protein